MKKIALLSIPLGLVITQAQVPANVTEPGRLIIQFSQAINPNSPINVALAA